MRLRYPAIHSMLYILELENISIVVFISQAFAARNRKSKRRYEGGYMDEYKNHMEMKQKVQKEFWKNRRRIQKTAYE